MGFYENTHLLRDGAILLYTRKGQKKGAWQVRLKLPGLTGYIIRSLKVRDLNAAIDAAEDLFYSLKAEQKLGLDVKQAGNIKFKDLWKRFYDAHESKLSVHRQKLHQLLAQKYFLPYFGDTRVADMHDAFVERYWDWRINFHKDAKDPEKRKNFRPNVVVVPAQKTLDMEAGMLRQIFRWGSRIGAVKRVPWIEPARVKHTKGVERRPSFERDEWAKVYRYLRSWVKEEGTTRKPTGKTGALHVDGPTSMHLYQRKLLREYLLVLANSGLRPNEARQLQWRDARVIEDEDGKPCVILAIAETTKTGARTVVCREGTERYLERLRAFSKFTEPGDLIFAGHDGKPVENFNKTFHKILGQLGLLRDRWGKRRTIYSLRHYYCTEALLSDVPIHTLALNMGTSIRHIETHYSHVITERQADLLKAKKFRPRPRARPKDAASAPAPPPAE